MEKIGQDRRAIRLKAFQGDEWFNISVEAKTCDCPDFHKNAGRCEHLTALGIHRLKPFIPKTHPTFSQALSGLVKSLRIRRVEDAVYWLVYLDTFKEPQSRFRTARRILIGAAEDGHSISVMERVVDSFRRISKVGTGLEDLVAEVVRICKVPNWWHPSTGGHDTNGIDNGGQGQHQNRSYQGAEGEECCKSGLQNEAMRVC